MKCPKCNSSNFVKDGTVKNRQRYLCKKCRYHYSVKERGKPVGLKKMAVELYLEGLGYRSIERILKVSNVSVMHWIKSFGKQVEAYRKPKGTIDIIELDELQTCVSSKKAIARSGFLLIGLDNNILTSCLVKGKRKQDV